ncbi:MAG: sugar phosphate isomerase/epimerase [Bryobacterales bacterium]|nr:sugar phosphate isomerase/epimerase [Bryobacterales bacterium]
MTNLFRIAAITDEFSQDLATALDSMAAIGMTGAELRMVNGKNVIDLTDEELDEARKMCADRGMEVISVASPLLKCTLPNSPDIDPRFQQDMFAAKYGYGDQGRLTNRAIDIAKRLGAPIIRVFSFWRTVEPDRCFSQIVAALSDLAAKAAKQNLIIGLENEHACNIATASESVRVLNAVKHPNLKLVWDPANCYLSGEDPYPAGYGGLPADRIAHVHIKDCFIEEGHKPFWGPVGTCGIDWRGQLDALARDGYQGWISLETHWPGPAGDKHQASVICGWNLKYLVMRG